MSSLRAHYTPSIVPGIVLCAMLLPLLAFGAGEAQKSDTSLSVSVIRPDVSAGVLPSVEDCRQLRGPVVEHVPCRLCVASLAPGWKLDLVNTVLPRRSGHHPSMLGSVETQVYKDTFQTLAPLVIYQLLSSAPGNSLRVAKSADGGVTVSF